MPGDPSSSCPTDEVLEAVACGQPVDESVRRHAAACRMCRAAVEGIRENNEFLAAFVPTLEDGVCPPAEPLPDPDVIPGYRILSEVHRGGQGVVYEALQESTRRTVAIKILREGPFAGPRDKARFEREVQILGRLNHRNIVTIHDSGSAAGSFYLVMNYISGQPLDAYVQDHSLSIEASLGLFARICEAVGAAHLHGVIHRDLKPTNILVDAGGEPHVLDFGLATVAAEKTADDSLTRAITMTGQFMGSLPWASPEQAQGIAHNIDLRTDVYSLGVILFQMLTGRFPYDVHGNMRDVLDNIMKAEPVRPGTLRREIDDEVETIVLKALAKEQERRYQSVESLRQDVQHYLAGDPIDAKRDSTWYMLAKSARRYRGPLIVAAMLFVLTAVFAVDRMMQTRRIAQQRDLAQGYAAELRETLHIARIEHGRTEGRAGNIPLAEELLWREHLNPPEILTAVGGGDADGVKGVEQDLSECRGPAYSHWALWELYARQPCLATWTTHSHETYRSVFSPDGAILASCGPEGTLNLWDLPSGKLLRALEPPGGAIHALGFSPDGALLASGGSEDLCLWNVADGRLLHVWHTDPHVGGSVAFSPDSGALALAAGDKTIRFWDIATRECRQVLDLDYAADKIGFSPDGRTLAAAASRDDPSPQPDGRVRLYDMPGARLRGTLDCGAKRGSFAFSPDGKILAVGVGLNVERWSITTLRRLSPFEGHKNFIGQVRFSPDGRWLASAAEDEVILWDVASGRLMRRFAGPGKGSLCFSPSGAVLALSAQDGAVRLWQVEPGYPRRIEHDRSVHCVQYSSDGLRLAISGGSDDSPPMLRLLDASSGRVLREFRGHTGPVAAVAFRHDDRVLASASHDGTLRIWDVETGEALRTFGGHRQPISTVAFSPDGRLLASGSEDFTVRLWDTATGECVHTFAEHTNRVPWVCFSPDGTLLASCSCDSTIILRDLTAGRIRAVFHDHPEGVRALCFSRDGRILASGSDDHTIRLWDVATGRCLVELEGHKEDVFSLCFRPDGHMLASAARGTGIKLWDPSSGRCLATLAGHENMVFSVCFHPLGRTLASGSMDGAVALWDLTFYDRHIAGNLEYQISRLPAAERDPARIQWLRTWVDEVRPRPQLRALWSRLPVN